MKKLAAFSLTILATASAFALPDYDSFTYTVGSTLIGQTNGAGQGWVQAGPNGTQATIQSGDLTVSGLASSGGGASTAFGVGTTGAAARYLMGSSVTSGTLYYSMAINVTSISGLTTGGIFFAGFNNSTATQLTAPSVVGTRLYARSITGSPGSFNLGVDKGGTLAAISWSSAVFSINTTIFVVGSYTFNTSSSTDDSSQLWINPDSSTFGNASAPLTSLISTDATTADITSIPAFEFRNGVAGVPAGVADDLRIGTNWSDVTPASSVPEPTTAALGGLGILALVAARRFSRK